jgi:nucleotide-binding universal stress UspA family protein
MEPGTKCLLLAIDESAECLRPLTFLTRLYPAFEDINLILCYFYPPLAPVYQEEPLTAAMAVKKEQLLEAQQNTARTVLTRARQALLTAGFAPERIQEHVQERSVSVAQHTCSLALIRKVDAVLVQKLITSKFEGFLKGDPTPGLLNQCRVSPIWFLDGRIDPSRAAICLHHEAASLRAVEHAAEMLAGTSTRIDLLHCDKARQQPLVMPLCQNGSELQGWRQTTSGAAIRPFLEKACQILTQQGINKDRVSLVVLPGKHAVAEQILEHSNDQHIGILVLGHSEPEGIWGFFEDSVTKTVLAKFKNMAIWVVQ